MRLVICGNGFDLHHKIDSSYASYKDYLQKRDDFTKEVFEYLASINDKKCDAWHDIEQSLGIDWLRLISSRLDQENVKDEIYDLNITPHSW